jgi:uncharacterized protein (DUF2147 family)
MLKGGKYGGGCGEEPMMLRFLPAILLALPFIGGGEKYTPDAIAGVWWTEEKDARVRIFQEKDGTWAGKIVWQAEPDWPEGDPEAGQPKRDRENPDPEKRNQPVQDLKILEGFEFDGKNEWKKGSVYNPLDGKTWKAKIKLKDENHMKLRGYVVTPLLGKNQVWTRYRPEKEDPPPEKEAAAAES